MGVVALDGRDDVVACRRESIRCGRGWFLLPFPGSSPPTAAAATAHANLARPPAAGGSDGGGGQASGLGPVPWPAPSWQASVPMWWGACLVAIGRRSIVMAASASAGSGGR
jgi:hypothetical protein